MRNTPCLKPLRLPLSTSRSPTACWALRQARGLSLAALADASGVSKAMISRVERAQSSATATLLGRLAAGLGVGLAELLAPADAVPSRLRRRADQPQWRDPELGYLRRQVAARDADGVELVEVTLPRGAQVRYPPWTGAPYPPAPVAAGRRPAGWTTVTSRTAWRRAIAWASRSTGRCASRRWARAGCRYLLVIVS